ncbi:extracellular solute-binding protein [bacterium D16-76]|nr:extracellular solute-binding protein [bacterium D16-76]
MCPQKAVSLLMAFLVLVAVLCSCSQEQKPKSDEQSGTSSVSLSQAENDTEESPVPDTKDAKQKLTFLTTFEHNYAGLKPWVEDFARLNPGVETEIEYGLDSLSSESQWDNYRTRWTTEVMSGEAPDILLDEGYINPAQYEQSGLMYDIYEWMDKDPDFQDTDYFHNLFEAFEVNGHLYTLPVTYYFQFVYLNDALLQASGKQLNQWDKINYRDIMEIYHSVEKQGLLAEDFTLEYMDTQPAYSMFLNTELVDYVSLEDRSTTLESPEFIEYLTATKDIPTKRKASDGLAMVGGRAQYMMKEFAKSNAEGNTSLMMDLNISLDGWIDHMDELVPGCAGPFVLTSVQGTQSFYPELKVCVPTSCKNPELAWKFLKFMIAPPEVPAYGQRWFPEGSVDLSKTFPVTNRENFRTFAKLYSQGANYVQETGGAPWPEDFDLISADCPVTDELLNKLEIIIEGITKTTDRFGPLRDLMLPELQEYYETDTVTAEQCAKRLQEIADLYLQE